MEIQKAKRLCKLDCMYLTVPGAYMGCSGCERQFGNYSEAAYHFRTDVNEVTHAYQRLIEKAIDESRDGVIVI